MLDKLFVDGPSAAVSTNVISYLQLVWGCCFLAFSWVYPRFKSTPSRYCTKCWWWCHHYHADFIIMMLTSLLWHQGKTWKYWTILLNTVHTGGLCGVLGFIAPLVLVWKTFQIYLYIQQCLLCPNCTSSNKTVTFGYLIDMGIADKPYNTPS